MLDRTVRVDYPIHPLAQVLPLMADHEYAELLNSIKERGGLIEPITLYHGYVLDGRHRLRACIEAGVQPQFTQLAHDTDPTKFVVDKNLTRRNLTKSQKTLAMAAFANYQLGHNQHSAKEGMNSIHTLSDQPVFTAAEAAKRAGVTERYLMSGKYILHNATEEEKESVRNGNASISTTISKIRERQGNPKPQKEPKPASKSPGARINLPDNLPILSAAKKGMMLENDGLTAEEAAKTLGIDPSTYRQVRDIVILQGRDDLNSADRTLVNTAISTVERTRQIAGAYEPIKPLVDKIYGHRGKRGRADKRRAEMFQQTVIVVEATCQRAAEMEVPYLPDDAKREALTILGSAVGNLKTLISKVKGTTSDK